MNTERKRRPEAENLQDTVQDKTPAMEAKDEAKAETAPVAAESPKVAASKFSLKGLSKQQMIIAGVGIAAGGYIAYRSKAKMKGYILPVVIGGIAGLFIGTIFS